MVGGERGFWSGGVGRLGLGTAPRAGQGSGKVGWGDAPPGTTARGTPGRRGASAGRRASVVINDSFIASGEVNDSFMPAANRHLND